MSQFGVFNDPTSHWNLIFYGDGRTRPTHTQVQWARIAHAIGVADKAMTEPTGGKPSPAIRGGRRWCAIAVAAYTDARDNTRPSPDTDTLCHADPALIHAWLDAPRTPPPPGASTVAEFEGWTARFAPGRQPDTATLALLVDAAQQVGVFGIPQGRVWLWRWFGDHAQPPDSLVVTVRTADETRLSSPLLDGTRLYEAGTAPTEAITAVLQAVAAEVNRLLGHRPPITPIAQQPAPSLPDGAKAENPPPIDRSTAPSDGASKSRRPWPPPPVAPHLVAGLIHRRRSL